MKPPTKQPLRSKAKDTPSPCCNAQLAADYASDGFFCVKCSRRYTFDDVLDAVLDTAAKPKASGGGATTIGIDDTDDVLNVNVPPPKAGAARPKMVPLSRTLRTYEVKDDLKNLCGARWDHINKQWLVPEDKFALAHQIVQRGPAQQKPPPVTGAPFTKSKFAGLDPDDMTFDQFQNLSWQDYERMRHQAAQRASSTAVRVETRTCWECGKDQTEADVKLKGGEWENFWCGCSGR